METFEQHDSRKKKQESFNARAACRGDLLSRRLSVLIVSADSGIEQEEIEGALREGSPGFAELTRSNNHHNRRRQHDGIADRTRHDYDDIPATIQNRTDKTITAFGS